MKKLARIVLLALLPVPAAALEPYLVKDIVTEPTLTGSYPEHLVTLRGAVLFFGFDSLSGRQLWRTDGTAAGTWRLSDDLTDPSQMTFFLTERLYFFLSGYPIFNSPSLWVSDGTPAGTFRLTEEGVSVISQPLWVASQGFLYFTADSVHGSELWRTDGTPAGTQLVADVRPGPEGSNVRGLAELNGRVWFGADDGVHGGSLWSTDGTPGGTALAIDPVPSSSSHGPLEHLQVLRNRLVFFAPPPGRGSARQLWAGDGTVKGTFPVTSFPRGTAPLGTTVTHANRLYFQVERKVERQRIQQLWVSDGTARGTRPLTSTPSRQIFLDLSYAHGVGNRLFFRGFDPVHGLEPWVTDGTPAGTRLLRDTCPGECSAYPVPEKVFAGRLYFIAAVDTFSTGLWSTDGTPAGTRLVKESVGQVHGFFEVGNRLVFASVDDEHGAEVWRTDGTAAGTVRITDFAPPILWNDDDEIELSATVLNGQLYFNADDGEHGFELWRTDGTAAGTELAVDVNQMDVGGSFPRGFLRFGSQVLFFTNPVSGPELWRSDGTEAGTVRVQAFGPEERDGTAPVPGQSAESGGVIVYLSFDYFRSQFAAWRTDGTAAGTFRLTGLSALGGSQELESAGGTVFFTFEDAQHGRELWATDGTVAGTRLVKDVIPGPAGSQVRDLTAFQGKLYFTAIAPGDGFELWRSDGTAAGTQVVADLHPGPVGSNPVHLTVHAGRLWFFTEGGEHLWSSDGTAEGTRLEVDFGEPDAFLATSMAPLGDRLLLSFQGQGLWVSDGTPAGTRKISIFNADSALGPWAVFQGRLFYIANGTLHVTDGTEAGTRQLLDRDGHPIAGPGTFEVLGDRLVFTVLYRVWESDGTPAGTHPVEPPARLNSPSDLVRAGNLVFFSSYDPATGWELWAARP